MNNGVGSANHVRIEFDKAVTALDAADVAGTSGRLRFNRTAASAANSAGTVWVVSLDGTMEDAVMAEETTYGMDLAAGAAVDSAGNQSAADADGANGDNNCESTDSPLAENHNSQKRNL